MLARRNEKKISSSISLCWGEKDERVLGEIPDRLSFNEIKKKSEI